MLLCYKKASAEKESEADYNIIIISWSNRPAATREKSQVSSTRQDQPLSQAIDFTAHINKVLLLTQSLHFLLLCSGGRILSTSPRSMV